MVLVMQTDARFWDLLVFEGIDEVEVEALTAAFGTVEAVARGRAVRAVCPDCGHFSDRVHDCCQRRLKDLPLADQRFVIRLTVRRFICGSADCPRRTFAESFSRLAGPVRSVHHAAQPCSGTGGTRPGGAGRSSAGGPTRFRGGADDLVTQGLGTARSAVQYSTGAGRWRLCDPSRPDLSVTNACSSGVSTCVSSHSSDAQLGTIHLPGGAVGGGPDEAAVIHERLATEHGFTGNYQRVKLYAQEARPRIAEELGITPPGVGEDASQVRGDPGVLRLR